MSDHWRGRSEGVGTLSVCSRQSSVKRVAWKVYPGGAGIEEAMCRVRSLEKNSFLWVLRAKRISLGRDVRAVSSVVGAKVT